jgi:hypothetical protein
MPAAHATSVRTECRTFRSQHFLPWSPVADRLLDFVRDPRQLEANVRPTAAHRKGNLPRELARLRRYGLISVDEVGYVPFEQDAANLFFVLVSSCYEHAALIPHQSNLPFSGWGGVFGDQAVAAAMIDRIVHYAGVLPLRGASYRLRRLGIDSSRASKREIRQTTETTTGGLDFARRFGFRLDRRRHPRAAPASPGAVETVLPGRPGVH